MYGLPNQECLAKTIVCYWPISAYVVDTPAMAHLKQYWIGNFQPMCLLSWEASGDNQLDSRAYISQMTVISWPWVPLLMHTYLSSSK